MEGQLNELESTHISHLILIHRCLETILIKWHNVIIAIIVHHAAMQVALSDSFNSRVKFWINCDDSCSCEWQLKLFLIRGSFSYSLSCSTVSFNCGLVRSFQFVLYSASLPLSLSLSLSLSLPSSSSALMLCDKSRPQCLFKSLSSFFLLHFPLSLLSSPSSFSLFPPLYPHVLWRIHFFFHPRP